MQKLAPGVFKEKLYLNDIDELYRIFNHHKNLLYTPILRSGSAMRLKMVCLGDHWNAKTYKYCPTREDVDNQPAPEFPTILSEIAEKYTYQIFPYHKLKWDIAIINQYDETKHDRLGLHRDNSESAEALEAGHPVVSFSLGTSCNFKFKDETTKLSSSIELVHGDVLVFGGPNRLMEHGVTQINRSDRGNQRINFTLRKL